MQPLRQKPPLTLDIGPLLDTQWTGIPVFTRRLAKALLSNGELEVTFACNLIRAPTERVLQAIRFGEGGYLAAEFQRETWEGPQDRRSRLARTLLQQQGAVQRTSRARGLDRSRHDDPVHAGHPRRRQHRPSPRSSRRGADDRRSDLLHQRSDARVADIRRALGGAAASGCCRNTSIGREAFELVDRNLPTLRPALTRWSSAPSNRARTSAAPRLARRRSRWRATRSPSSCWVSAAGWSTISSDNCRRNRRARIAFTGFVSEFVKYRLLKGAQFLVFPSLCEGFGIPALEALSLGKPVLASRSSSLPEVVGDAGVYFDPMSMSEFAAALDEIADPRKLAELRRAR